MQPDLVSREFHISRQARDRYQFDAGLYMLSGNVIFPNFLATRVFAQKMNAQRDLARHPERTVRAGDLNAMGLIDEILHFVINQYRVQKKRQVLGEALDWLERHLGRAAMDQALEAFTQDFPPLAVYRGQQSLAEYLRGETAGEPHRQVALEEMLMLWLGNMNPAFSPFLELFDDARLEHETAYLPIMASLHDFFDTQPRFGPDNQNLVDMLRAPALASPHSLAGQLEFILKRWGPIVERYSARVLSSLDFIKEEQRMQFVGPGPAQVPVYTFAGAEYEPERFTPDRDWMPELVLIAKNVYVWLDQLTRAYGTSITRLDQIPDAELDRLARWGFSGLWFIGLWQRSGASRRIKQMTGNPEAVASAYSIFDYQIAADLGGEAALANLRERAWQRRIRLASDMVPNHMAIDSRWVIEHPDWFVALDASPFPSYSFNGPDLSWDGRVGLFLEDHYYDRTDAAVVFKRLDRWTGSEKYIYHGNDGTSMPWNDTAQLNYLAPEVREAVIQTILHVARQFPVIRFDAAMTLAKKHYARLWFPEPGTGGAIPSRAEHGISKAEFDARMPDEFWREVVDRIAAEAPDTLLLAEAFWLMEGYFVRSLGMHRVYNSAFMNMLRDEDNAKYRSVMKNTLEFDPEILKRYVNFMNNPDERTAVDQFGKGDKYFGVCTLMATLPGLPMFGHGQIEGFTEKYGMEYQRAYRDEQPDPGLVERHEREIFPLLRQRYLFAGVDNFLLYDFFTPEGHVNEDVFAYSNRAGDARALVLYHNKYASARGWIRTSAAYLAKTGQGDERKLVQRTLADGWGLMSDPGCFVQFRDQATGLEYLRSCQEMHAQGLYVELNAYQYHVFLDVRVVQDDERELYRRAAAALNGRGVPSVDELLREMALEPVLTPFKRLFDPVLLRALLDVSAPASGQAAQQALLDDAKERMAALLSAVNAFGGGQGDAAALAAASRRELQAILGLGSLAGTVSARSAAHKAVRYLDIRRDDLAFWGVLLGWWSVHSLGRVLAGPAPQVQSRAWIDEWLLGRAIAQALGELGLDQAAAWHSVAVIRILTSHANWCETEDGGETNAGRVVQAWLEDEEVRAFIQVNRYDSVLWFNKEGFDELLRWMFAAAAVGICASRPTATQLARKLAAAYAVIDKLAEAEAASGFRVEALLAAVGQPAVSAPSTRPRVKRAAPARRAAKPQRAKAKRAK